MPQLNSHSWALDFGFFTFLMIIFMTKIFYTLDLVISSNPSTLSKNFISLSF